MPSSCCRVPLLILCFLLTVCLAAPGPAQEAGEEPDFDALVTQFEAARAAGDYDLALDLALQKNELAQIDYIFTLRDVAAMHSRLGHTEEAYEWLQESLDAGFWDFRALMNDEAFATISEEKRFRAMLRQAWTTQYLSMLEREGREDFQKPEKVMETLDLKPGEKVADIGAGSGYFTIPVARAVGEEGVVWAIDIRREMLDHIAGRLEAEGLKNVRLMQVGSTDPQLPEAGVDTILMVDVLHYVKDRAAYAKKLKYGLAPGGRVVIIDFRPKPFEERPWGPPPSQQMSKEEVDADFATAGFKVLRSHEFLPEQYFVEYGLE